VLLMSRSRYLRWLVSPLRHAPRAGLESLSVFTRIDVRQP
jgi:hypothetical protein